MRTGKELILATKPYASEVRWKSWYYTLSTLLILLALFAGTVFIPSVYGRAVCGIFAGFVLVRMFVIYHDHQHASILRNSWMANALFNIFGVFILAPPSIWQRSHDYHHNHNSKLFGANIGSWPIYTRERFLKSSKHEQFAYLFIRHPLTIFFGYPVVFFYGLSIQSFMSTPHRHKDSLLAIVLHLAGSFAVFWLLGWQAWLFTVIIPFMVACMIGSYLFYAQHNFPGVTFKNNIEWSYDNAALESSSYMVMNPFWRWVTANIGYHHIHHINARIPFYRLPEVYQNIPELQQAKITTLNPSDIIACFRLKVWDPERNKMIGLSQL